MAEDDRFALQWLDFLGNELYNNGQQIFKYNGEPKYPIGPLTCRVKIGEDLGGDEEEEATYTRLSFGEFEKLGFIVIKGSNFTWRKGQKFHYKIVRNAKNKIGIAYMNFHRMGLQIQHDAKNRQFRLCGENALADKRLNVNSGVGPWVIYDEDRPITPHYNKKKSRIISKEDARARLKVWTHGRQSPQVEFRDIKELPVMLSDEKYLVCIPKEDTCQRIIISGESGTGKSILSNALAGRIFYIWQDRQGWLIDPLNQFEDLSLPQDYNGFQQINDLIDNEAKPIPAIQLYMACRYKLHIKYPEISLKVVQDFYEFLNRYKYYIHGLKDMDVGETIRYMSTFAPYIKNVETKEQLKAKMEEAMPEALTDKGKGAMVKKWEDSFGVIFKEKFTSNLYKLDRMAASCLEVKFKDGTTMKEHPFIACYEAGVVPVLNISAARRQRWFRNYLADLMQKIVRHQSDLPDKLKKRVWLIVDELNVIYEQGKQKDNAHDAFIELFKQGRFNNIGFVCNTQSVTKLSQDMYDNATHTCSTYIKNAKERRMIGAAYDLDKQTYNQLGELKKHEMMIFSKDNFIVYDKWGRRRKMDRKWFKGRILPPINFHKAPPS